MRPVAEPVRGRERCVLAGLRRGETGSFEEDIQEMAQLCDTAGAIVVHTMVQRRERIDPATYWGAGKLAEIAAVMQRDNCTTLVADAELSPAQVRNIEETVRAKVIDRSQLILDIFARHAATSEARIQVELAQMRTLYPRLTHAWSHFSQQVGGIGTRGPGETQLEVDRRLIQKKISELHRRLHRVEQSHRLQRRSRKRQFNATLVGYTNVGKSSLLNRLCGSRVLVRNQLFATLDTASRRTWLPGAGSVVLSDTVGFLRRLPHHLVASFRSTLEVVCDSDLIVVVLDASSPWSLQQGETVDEVLDGLGAADRERMVVYNKSDSLTSPLERKRLALRHPGALFVSAVSGEGVEEVRLALAQHSLDCRRDREQRDREPVVVEEPLP